MSKSTQESTSYSQYNHANSSKDTQLESLAKSKGLTPNQIIEMRRQNLCYGCKEKWSRDHKCKNLQVYVLEGMMRLQRWEGSNESEVPITESKVQVEETLAITLQDLCGIPALSTI